MKMGFILCIFFLSGCAGLLKKGSIGNSYNAYAAGDYKKVISKVDRTLIKYELSDVTTSRLLFLKARSYMELKEYFNAVGVHRYIVKTYPDSEASLKAESVLSRIEPIIEKSYKNIKKKRESLIYDDSRCKTNVAPINIRKTPVVMVEQKYPARTDRKKTQRYAKLEFDVSEQGTVKNIRVMEPRPPKVFVDEAKKALLRWKYKPEFEGNKSIISLCHRVRLGFVINNRRLDFPMQLLN